MNFLKEKAVNTWNWTKDKVKRGKRWIIGLFVPVVMAAGGVAITDEAIDPYVETDTHFELSVKEQLPEEVRNTSGYTAFFSSSQTKKGYSGVGLYTKEEPWSVEYGMGIKKFDEIGYSDWSVAAAFYAIYQCFLAIGLKFGYESQNQQCTIALMEKLVEDSVIDLEQKYIDLLKYQEDDIHKSIIDLREDYTYGFQLSIENKEQLDEFVKTCREVIDVAKQIIYA